MRSVSGSLNHATKKVRQRLGVCNVQIADVFDLQTSQAGEQEVFLFNIVLAVLVSEELPSLEEGRSTIANLETRRAALVEKRIALESEINEISTALRS